MAMPAEAAALAAVGLRPAAPVVGLSVLAMPPLLDATPMVAAPVTWRARPNAYVQRRGLALQGVREGARRVGAIGVVGITFRERPIVGDDEGHTTSGGWMPVEFTAVATPVL